MHPNQDKHHAFASKCSFKPCSHIDAVIPRHAHVAQENAKAVRNLTQALEAAAHGAHR